MTTATWPAKDPDEVFAYSWVIELADGETISSSSFEKVSGSVVIDLNEQTETGRSVKLSGGASGEINQFHGLATTNLATYDITVYLPVISSYEDVAAAYGTDAGFAAWLAQQGYALPATAPSLSILRARGSAYVDGYETRWTGQRAAGAMQELGWPRTGATLNCSVAIADDAIPPAVIRAAYRAAWLDAQTPGILVGPVVTPGARVKRQRVEGAVEREFFDDGKAEIGSGPSFIDSAIDGLMAQFICDAKGGAFMWSVGG